MGLKLPSHCGPFSVSLYIDDLSTPMKGTLLTLNTPAHKQPGEKDRAYFIHLDFDAIVTCRLYE